VKLDRSFYERPTLEVARDLIGKVLVHRTRAGLASGIIIEAEAYIGEDDPACHASPGPTRRNEPLYGHPGVAYVYFNYGMHHLVNAVTEREGYPAAVLVRALEPLEGIAVMRRRRGVDRERLLCSGPARLCQALGITGAANGKPLDGPRLRILPRARRSARAPAVTPRIGIRAAADWPLRFVEAGSPWTSRPAPRGGAGRDR